jgi:integrase
MKRRSQLTDLFVRSVTVDKGQKMFWDRGNIGGFGLRVSAGGMKAWTLAYRNKAGRMRWLKLGTYPVTAVVDARDAARIALAQIQQGLDPAEEKRKAREDRQSFAALCDRYLNEYARPKKKPRSVAEDARLIRTELLPRWASWNPEEIQRRDVRAAVEEIARRAPILANRVLALMSKLFNFALALEEEIVTANPAYKLAKPGQEHSRERNLNDHEITALWLALSQEPKSLAALFKMLILTGARRSEVAEMAWSEVDLDKGWWEIPSARTKNNCAHLVPLVGLSLELLRELRSVAPADQVYVFSGHKPGRPYVNLAKPSKRLKTRSGIDCTIHDLRRSAATGWARIGVPTTTIERLLNHAPATSQERIHLVYNKYQYLPEKREALERWTAHLLALTAPPANLAAAG